MNTLRSSQILRGGAVGSNRQPMPPTAALYLSQLRQQPLKAPPPLPRRQIAIQVVEVEEQPQEPRMVKIIQTDLI